MDYAKNKSVTKKIVIFGVVQGVGFRPNVYRLAKKHGINGTVSNVGGLVEIITSSSQKSLDDFLFELKNNKTRGYEILNIEIEDLKMENYADFNIIESSNNDAISIISPDLPVCQKCQKELYTISDKRFHNPFISCMSCGARYTIMQELPYDRNTTTMQDFIMCSSCHKDYISTDSRRYHAQTISCNNCGPYLIFNNLINEQAFEETVKIINAGGIVAVKSIGGYNFVCSPFKEATVKNLRKLKGRETKPFAVMFESLASVREYCIVSKAEKNLLESKAKPIVLLYTQNGNMAKSTNLDSLYCGAFLPYTPLQIMLTKSCGPLIMTSANISDKPIIKDDLEMLNIQSPFLSGVLYNTRRIIRSVDDSVAKVTDHKPQLIRRSRGYVPYPILLGDGNRNLQIFAAGSDLKACFCIYKQGSAIVSQYFGDLEEHNVMEEYKESVADLLCLMKIDPCLVICDLHPNYHSTRYTESLGIPIMYVQHHHAHIASVMAEHNLHERVIGVAFDGTGYGTDGNIWGGEFLICEGADFTRFAHLNYMPILGGNQSMLDAKKTATCFLLQLGLGQYVQDQRSNLIGTALKNNVNTILSSSMGRLFDAVAAILEIQDYNFYEGQCAINLEKAAILALRNKIRPQKIAFTINRVNGRTEIDIKSVLKKVCRLKEKVNVGSLALGFHYAVADLILEICKIIRVDENINKVALSGGVFQNTVLIERALSILRKNNFNVYYNLSVPPNDGSISLGQVFIGLMR
ncbi:MAG: carbamoyltransferase HypF [Clostridia bacterium]